jgi:hypothetical protein
MNKGIHGTVLSVRLEIVGERLHAVVAVRTDAGEMVEAHMPDREMSALLPRSVLVGQGRRASLSLLATVQPILARLTEGRQVRVWQFKERWFFSFQPWKGVRFVPDEPAVPAETAVVAEPVPAP